MADRCDVDGCKGEDVQSLSIRVKISDPRPKAFSSAVTRHLSRCSLCKEHRERALEIILDVSNLKAF